MGYVIKYSEQSGMAKWYRYYKEHAHKGLLGVPSVDEAKVYKRRVYAQKIAGILREEFGVCDIEIVEVE